MKEFFEQCLRDLHKLTGLKQYFEICNKPTEAEAKEEMAIIVGGMVRVSEKFNYIPQDAQKRIVSHQIISDHEMYALNAKMVYKWFNAVSDKYWHESGHIGTNALLKEETVRQISEEEQKRIDEIATKFLAELANGTIREVPQVSEFELEQIKTEDKIRREGVSKGIHFTPESEIRIRELHLEWIKENYELITGKPKETWLSEQEWLLNKGLFIDGNEIKQI